MSQTNTPPAGMRAVTKKSALPIYAVGAVWLVWALLSPLYSVTHYLICAAVSLLAYAILSKAIPDTVTYEKIPVQATGYATADDLLKAGDQYLRDISAVSAKIENAEVRAKADKLGGTCQRIFDYVRQNPKSADGLRKFMNYYLPTTIKLLHSYDRMSSQGIEGENLDKSMKNINEMLDAAIEAFKKRLDSLFADQALDIETDIEVMNTMLAREGLSGGRDFQI